MLSCSLLTRCGQAFGESRGGPFEDGPVWLGSNPARSTNRLEV